jgi:hypothetical protein
MVTTRRGQKEASESNPLLEVAQRSNKPKTHYDAAAAKSQPGSSGRGKLRFAVRQQILEQRRQNEGRAGTYKSIFGSKPKATTKKVSNEPKHTHSALYEYLNPKSHAPSAKCFQKFITLVILIDVIFYVVSTEPKFEDLSLFYYAECITSSIFLVEYISRLAVCTEQVSLQSWQYQVIWFLVHVHSFLSLTIFTLFFRENMASADLFGDDYDTC